jgi:hypothetical protein
MDASGGMPLLTPPYVLEPGQTIWFEFAITYTRRDGGIEGWDALLRENGQDVCATAGTGIHCSSSFLGGDPVAPFTEWREFPGAGAVSSGVTTVVIDLKNENMPCGQKRKLVNTVTATPSLYTGGWGPRVITSSAAVEFKSPDCAQPPPPPPPPGPGCTLTQGYWKNHAAAWPVSSLKLGTVTYTKAQLIAILETPVRGNGLVSLAHQLIAAKLNVAKGASPRAVAAAISLADAMIGSRVIPPVGGGSLSTSATGLLTEVLDAYNNGKIGPGHCDGKGDDNGGDHDGDDDGDHHDCDHPNKGPKGDHHGKGHNQGDHRDCDYHGKGHDRGDHRDCDHDGKDKNDKNDKNDKKGYR